jgi:Phospholipase B
MLEGYLTHEIIYMYYLNTLQDYCEGRDEYCSKIRHFLATNSKWVKKMYKKLRNTSSYWHQVEYFRKKLKAIVR